MPTKTFSFERFGREDDTWNIEIDGNPGVMLVARALHVWTTCQPGEVSVSDVTTAFRLPPSMVVEAVEAHPWMLLVGPRDDFRRLMIEHDGE